MLEDKLEELDNAIIPVLDEDSEVAVDGDWLLELVTSSELKEEDEVTLDIDVSDEIDEYEESEDEMLEFKLLKLETLDEDMEETLDEDMEEKLDDEKYMSGNGLSKTYTAVSEPS